MLTVADLIQMLCKIPQDTKVYLAEASGISQVEEGNLFPLKFLKTKFGSALYIDDGYGDHGTISSNWTPLDQYTEIYN